ncbi:MAG: DUF1588 domain-containing protein [Myxococcota bacterium]
MSQDILTRATAVSLAAAILCGCPGPLLTSSGGEEPGGDPGGTPGGTPDAGAVAADAGTAVDGGSGPIDTGVVIPPPPGVAAADVRRLSAHEFDNAIRDLLGDDARLGAAALPEDFRTPFDNEANLQESSRVLVEAADSLANTLATRLVEDSARRAQIVGCTTADVPCMRDFITRFGRRVLRRSLTATEIDSLIAVADLDGQDFWSGVRSVVRVLLQDLEFLYRLEQATEVADAPGIFRVSGFEVATRMALTIWGTVPDDALLNAAEAGSLDTAAGRRTEAARMLADRRAIDQADRFHAMWLGYETLPVSQFLDNELEASMRAETYALIERVLFQEDRRWTDIFLYDQAYVNGRMLFGGGLFDQDNGIYKDLLPLEDGVQLPGWVSLDRNPQRLGLLSQASFAAVAGGLDTSPVRRGVLVRERLLCETIPPPPPNVEVDAPPSGGGDCKEDRYRAHREDPGCAGCHSFMDPVGFGLERFDKFGGYRTRDYADLEARIEGAPGECEIAGSGSVVSTDGTPPLTFEGPAGLARELVQQQIIDACMARYFVTYAMGRSARLELNANIPETPFIEGVLTQWRASGGKYSDLIYALIERPEFTQRWEVLQ